MPVSPSRLTAVAASEIRPHGRSRMPIDTHRKVRFRASIGPFAKGRSGSPGKKVKLEVEQGDQRQAGRHGAVSEFGERLIEKEDLAPDVLALASETVDASGIRKVDLLVKDVNDLGEGAGRNQVNRARTQGSCRDQRVARMGGMA
jgi:hypothetical protein